MPRLPQSERSTKYLLAFALLTIASISWLTSLTSTGATLSETTGPYAATILQDGPVGYWRLEELIGNPIIDSSGFGLHLNNTNYTGCCYPPALGRPGALKSEPSHAFRYTGWGSNTGAPSDAPPYDRLAFRGPFTIETWFQPDVSRSHDEGFWREVLIARTSDAVGYQLGWGGGTDGFVFRVSTADPATGRNVVHQAGTPYPLVAGEWYHVVGVYDGNSVAIYVNGDLRARAASQGALSLPSTEFHIGYGVGGEPDGQGRRLEGAYGTIDEVAAYGRALSEENIRRHYQASGRSIEPVLTGLSTNRGGNEGVVSLRVLGNHLPAGIATVTLNAPDLPVITGQSVALIDSSQIAATFDLRGNAVGPRSVIVTFLDGKTLMMQNAFTIEAGGEAQIWVDIIGRDTVRPGRFYNYEIVFGNRGNVDAMMVPIWIAVTRDAYLNLLFEVKNPLQPNSEQVIDWNQVPLSYEHLSDRVYPLRLPLVPAGYTGRLKIAVSPNLVGNLPLVLKTWTGAPLLNASQTAEVIGSLQAPLARQAGGMTALSSLEDDINTACHPLESVDNECSKKILSTAGNNILGLAPGVDCVKAGLDYSVCSNRGAVGPYPYPYNYDYSVTSMLRDLVGAAGVLTTCAEKDFPVLSQVVEVVGIVQNAADWAGSCIPINPKIIKFISTVTSIDPNDKFGPQGIGPARFIFNAQPLNYAISFENLDTALAPAQDVIITDQLDAGKLDLNTLSLGTITFGDKQVTPQQGLKEFKADVDLRPEKNLIVRVDARLNEQTGLLTWRFTSLDPSTGLPPDDPLAGFLPPNLKSPEGEGQVSFSVQAKNGLATGTEIRNRARIVFDTNPFIDTPEWYNTIDNTKPTSRVLPLESGQCANTINLKWSGTDGGSGIQDFTIFISDNGGPLVPLLSHTTATSTVFEGQAGHTYAFYSLSQDNTYNVEEPHALPDVTVTIYGAAPPVLTLKGANPLTVLYRQTFIDPGATALDACDGDLTGSIARTGSVNTNVVGTYVLTYSVKDAQGNTSTSTRTVKVSPHPPATKDDCKNVGWQFRTTANGQPFQNQGMCVSYFNTGK